MITKIRAMKDVSDVEVDVRATEDGILGNVSIERLWTARGYGRQAMATAAIASLIVRPSALSMVTLYNNTAKNLVIERVFAHNLVSLTNGAFGIWVCVHPIGMTAPTGNDISIRNSLSGLAAGTEGIFDVAESVADDGWFPWGVSQTTVVTSVPGTLAEALINGRIVLPPTAGISLQSVGQTSSVTVTMGLHWFAVPITEFAVN